MGVVVFELDAVFKAEVAAARDLPVAGDAGFHRQEVGADVVGDVFPFARHERAVADQRHVTDEDVEELRDFIERSAAEKMTEFRDARVVFKFFVFFPVSFVFGVFKSLFENGIGVFDHGAEFKKAEFATVEADAFLNEEDGAEVAGQHVGEFNENRKGGGEETAEEAKEDVERTFDDSISESREFRFDFCVRKCPS